MQELNVQEIENVNGAGTGEVIAAGVASAWAGTVVGAAAGSILPGLGTIGGAVVGFGFSVLQVFAWGFATSSY